MLACNNMLKVELKTFMGFLCEIHPTALPRRREASPRRRCELGDSCRHCFPVVLNIMQVVSCSGTP